MRFAAVAGVLFLTSGAAFAADPNPPPPPKGAVAHRNPCADDVVKFCDKVPFGAGQRLKCLDRHNAQLSPACRPELKFMLSVFAVADAQRKKNEAAEAAMAKRRAEAAKQKAATTHGPAAATPSPQPQH